MSQGQESSSTFTLNKGLVSMIYARISVLLQKKKIERDFLEEKWSIVNRK